MIGWFKIIFSITDNRKNKKQNLILQKKDILINILYIQNFCLKPYFYGIRDLKSIFL